MIDALEILHSSISINMPSTYSRHGINSLINILYTVILEIIHY